MSYLWNDFNIKTFPAETLVYRDGVFCPELSTLNSTDILQTYSRPVHIIFTGVIAGKNDLDINIGTDNQPVFLSVNVKNEMPAFLNILIKNAGKNSKLSGQVCLHNFNRLIYTCNAGHFTENTGILVKTKLLGEKNSYAELTGCAKIEQNCANTESYLSFSAMLESGARVKFEPAQRINSVPDSASHSASLFQASDAQIQYLRSAGLGILEIRDVVKEAFMNDF